MRSVGLVALVGVMVVAACASEPDGKRSDPPGGSAGLGALAGTADKGESGAPPTDIGGVGGEASGVSPTAGANGVTVAGEGGVGGIGGSPQESVDGPVAGVVLSGLEPVVAIAVVLDGATTLTAANGSFEFASAPATYSLTLLDSVRKVALVLDGMSGRNPVIQFPGARSASHLATVRGKFFDVGNAGSSSIALGFASDRRGTLGIGDVPATEPSYGLTLRWTGATTQTGKVAGLVAARGSYGCPVSYSGYAEAKLSVNEGDLIGDEAGSVSATSLTFAPLAGQRTLEGQVSVPAGYYPDDFHLDIGPFSYTFGAPTGDYSCAVPQEPALQAAVRFAAKTLGQGENVTSMVSHAVPESGSLDAAVPVASLPVLPIAGATGVTSATPFSWTAAAPQVMSRVRFNLGSWTIWRVTKASTTTLPDLSAYGAPLPNGIKCYWLVGGYGPANDADQAATLRIDNWGAGPAEYISTFATERAFTLAN